MKHGKRDILRVSAGVEFPILKYWSHE